VETFKAKPVPKFKAGPRPQKHSKPKLTRPQAPSLSTSRRSKVKESMNKYSINKAKYNYNNKIEIFLGFNVNQNDRFLVEFYF
jgi:chromosome segregation ATPase